MVNILQPLLQGERAGQRAAEIFGQGLDEATNRYLLSQGIENVQKMLQENQAAGKKVNPINLTLDLAKTFSRVPGGLQALSDLAPSLKDEVLRQNLLIPDKEEKYEKKPGQQQSLSPAQEAQLMPEGSIYEGAQPGVSRQEGRLTSPDLEPTEDTFINKLKKYLRETGDINAATNLATKEWETMSAEDKRRFDYQKNAMELLNQKVAENFVNGISAPFQNELAEQYFNLIGRKNPNAAWNELLPKFRAAQVDEENLKTATGSNRPLLFLGDMKQRMENARTALQKIINIDPEYAQALAQNKLGYGAAEAAKIVRPPTKEINQFVSQINRPPRETQFVRGGVASTIDRKAYQKGLDKWTNETKNKLKQYLQKKFNPKTDSFLVLRSDLYDKGVPESLFLETVNEVFPNASENPKLSTYNQNEYSKLSEPIIPGLQEIFSLITSDRAESTFFESLGKKIQRKR